MRKSRAFTRRATVTRGAGEVSTQWLTRNGAVPTTPRAASSTIGRNATTSGADPDRRVREPAGGGVADRRRVEGRRGPGGERGGGEDRVIGVREQRTDGKRDGREDGQDPGDRCRHPSRPLARGADRRRPHRPAGPRRTDRVHAASAGLTRRTFSQFLP